MASFFTAAVAFARRAVGRAGLVRFRRNQSGATVIEFALVAAPFFALLFAIIETALLFFADQALDTAVSSAARLIRTGQAQEQGITAAGFKNQICSQIVALFDCASGLQVDVETYANFDNISLGIPVDSNGNLKVPQNYNTGHGGDIVVVRAYYEWPLIGLFGNLGLADMPDGTHLLVATAAFRNEPFSW